MKALVVAAALSVFGTGTTQPPATPAPREIPLYNNLTISYSGPEDTKSPKVEMSVKDGKIEVRWTMQQRSYTAIAAQALVHDGVLTVIGTAKEPAAVSCGALSQQSGARIEIVLADGTMKVYGNGSFKMRAP